MNQQLPTSQHQEVHFQDYLNIIKRRRKTFAVTFVVVVAAIALFTFLVPPLYESVATVFVKDDQGKVGQMGDLLMNGPAAVDSEIEILKSRSNAEKVVSKLHLDWKVDKVSDGVAVQLLEFSSTVKEPVYHVQLVGDGSYTVRDDDGNLVGNGTSGVLLRGKGLSLLVKDLKGAKGASFRLTLLPFKDTVEKLRKKIRIAEVGKKTNVIAITYRNRDPQVACDVVNTLVQAYLDKGVALKAEVASRTVSFVTDQLKGVKAELESAEKNLAAYKRSAGVIELDASAQNLIDSLSEAEKQKAEVVLHKKQVEFALASMRGVRAKGNSYSPAIAGDDPVLANMAARLSDLEVQKRGLLSDSTENAPGVKLVQSQIDELQKKIQATYETALRNDSKKVENLSAEIGRRDAQLKQLPAAEQNLARLLRLSKVNSDIYTFLLQKHEEARIAEASTINNISIVDPAIAADRPVFPRKGMTLLLALTVGGMLGVVRCFFAEYMDDTLKDPEDARRNLALPLLAVIPHIPNDAGDQSLIAHHSPKSLASEAFRGLRTSLHFCSCEQEKKVILVTSALPNEGKSTVSCNLAITLAQAGAQVLVIDGDLRRSTLHQNFGFSREHGLTEALVGDIALDAAIQETAVSGLYLLKSGVVPPNPSEMLGSMAMRRVMEEMKKRFTYVIVDAPPVLAVTDAAVLTQMADLVLVVVEAGRVPVKAAQETRDTLLAAAAPIAGLVISDKNPDSQASGYGYGYKYAYGYGDLEGQPKKRWSWLRIGRPGNN